ncbi:MAG: gamma-glutamyltransferase family protein [Rhizobacter sp.]|nr:gamma-glutamyltransferase family protein [Rhizobacter sp.]
MRGWRMQSAGWLAALLLLGGCAGATRSPGAPGSPAVTSPVVPPVAPPLATPDTPGVVARHVMVAAANPLASAAGLRMLRAGGSAVDAGIAVQMVLTLVEPQSSGIGGGVFIVHHDGRKVETIDGRETAPAAARPDLFMKDGQPMGFMDAVVGGRSVGVPGTLRALALAHQRHGRLPWKTLFQPAIELAERGFEVSPRLAGFLRDPAIAASLKRDREAAAYFFDAAGQPREAGVVLRNPALAAVLRSVAERGASALYGGRLARDIVAKVRRHAGNPGLMTQADLARYRPRLRDPLCFDYRVWRVCGMGPPSSGTLALGQVLGMLSSHDLAAHAPRGMALDPLAVHWVTEAYRLAFADRERYVGDPDFVRLPGGDAKALLDPAYLAQRAALIGERSMGHASPGDPLPQAATSLADDRSPELPSTSHVSVVDGFGNSLSMTMTIENLFGSRLMVHGFMLNNELTDFSFVPSEGGRPVANRVQGGKRPRSSMSPVLVFDRTSGNLVMSVGSPGGPFIISFVGKTLIGALDWQLPLQQAMALPNFGSRNGPTELEDAPGVQALADALRARGHEVKLMRFGSGLNGVQRVPGGWAGGTDPRGEGAVLGE